MKTLFRLSISFMKNVMMFLLLITSGIATAQKPQVTFDEPQEEPANWRKTPLHNAANLNILNWDDNEIIISSFKEQLYLARIDKNLNIKENSTTRLGKSHGSKDNLLRIWHENDSIYVIIREERNVYLYTFDFRSLLQTNMKQIYTVSKHDPSQTETPVDIAWSDNGEYIALVVRHIPRKSEEFMGMRKKQSSFHEFCLYDKHFNPVGSGVFDAVVLPHRVGTGLGYASSWTLTDNGEIVFVSLKAARNPADYPDFGATATQMEIGLFKDGKMTTSTIPNVYRGNLPIGAVNCTEDIEAYENRNSFSMSLRTGTSLRYDGKSMMIFFLNTLYKYSFEDNTVTPQVAMRSYLEPTYYSSGLSDVIDDNEGGQIIRGIGGFVWIPQDISKSFMGSWNVNNSSSTKWSVSSTAATRSMTFLRNDRLYHLADMEKSTTSYYIIGISETTKKIAPQITCVDKKGTAETFNLDAGGYTYFYKISDNRIALWEGNIKVNGKACLRFGHIDIP